MGTEVPAGIAVPVQPPDGSVGLHVGTSPPESALPQRTPKLFMRPVLIELELARPGETYEQYLADLYVKS